jgi:hypothetical protein
MGFDQMMAFYNHFVVLKARIICTFRALFTGTQTATGCIRIDADSTPLTVIDRIVEFGGLVQTDLTRIDTPTCVKTLELSLDVAKLQGVSPSAITADPSLQGNVAASPLELSYFHVAVWDSQGTSFTASVDVILEQLVTFIEPRDLTQS